MVVPDFRITNGFSSPLMTDKSTSRCYLNRLRNTRSIRSMVSDQLLSNLRGTGYFSEGAKWVELQCFGSVEFGEISVEGSQRKVAGFAR